VTLPKSKTINTGSGTHTYSIPNRNSLKRYTEKKEAQGSASFVRERN
jgi:hypothetical protein